MNFTRPNTMTLVGRPRGFWDKFNKYTCETFGDMNRIIEGRINLYTFGKFEWLESNMWVVHDLNDEAQTVSLWRRVATSLMNVVGSPDMRPTVLRWSISNPNRAFVGFDQWFKGVFARNPTPLYILCVYSNDFIDHAMKHHQADPQWLRVLPGISSFARLSEQSRDVLHAYMAPQRNLCAVVNNYSTRFLLLHKSYETEEAFAELSRIINTNLLRSSNGVVNV